MRLSARAIINYANINSFAFTTGWTVRLNDPNTLYFQLIDLDQATQQPIPGQAIQGYYYAPIIAAAPNPGLRYLTGIGTPNQPVQVTVTFPSIDSAKVLTLIATQADANDSSVWAVAIPSASQPNSGNVQFQVAEGVNIRRFSVQNMISVETPTNEGSDGCIPTTGTI